MATSLEESSSSTSEKHAPPQQNDPVLDREPEVALSGVVDIALATNPTPPPNGGVRAWLQVLGGFMLFFNSWGILNTFGVLQTYYESGALFSASSSTISFVGSIQGFLLLFVGFLVGPVYDRGHLRLLLLVGTVAVVFGLMISSIATQYWHVLLAQGFSIGIGAGCLFVPCVSIMPSYFSTKLGLAVGIASTGSSAGGLIYPIVLNELLYRIGFAWAVRVLGFIVLGTLLIPLSVMRMRVVPRKSRSFIDWSAFRDIQFMFFVIATLIGFIGISILLTYLAFYAADTGTTDTRMVFYLVSIFNGASVVGRLTPAALSDVTGPFNIAPCAIISGVLSFSMIAARGSPASLIVLTALVGLFSGVFVSLPSVCAVSITKDKSRLGTRIGMACGIMAFGLLTGGPGGGSILGTREPLDWVGLWVFCGVAFTISGLMYALQRFYLCGFKIWAKV
ncbi:MFS general substrate transporter [Xylariaceae sp. FL1651]|nr:MFS general substrate transporter [Xylariaceae sp. FL1651]